MPSSSSSPPPSSSLPPSPPSSTIMGFTIADIPDLTGQVAVITGGHAGIGQVCSQALAKRGARVLLLARSKDRYDSALESFREDDEESSKRWSYVPCDLADLESVQTAAAQLAKETDHIDILLNNAGIMAMPYALTKQGLEVQCGTNVVGHALLSYLLLPLLVSTARARKAASQSSVRVVQLSSLAHRSFGIGLPSQSWENLERVNEKPGWGFIGAWRRYGKSKVGNILLATHLHKLTLGEHISHISVHPGIISTGLYKAVTDSYGILGRVARKAISSGAITPEQGSLSSLYAATSPDIDDREMSGTYLDPLAVVGAKAPWVEDADGMLADQMITDFRRCAPASFVTNLHDPTAPHGTPRHPTTPHDASSETTPSLAKSSIASHPTASHCLAAGNAHRLPFPTSVPKLLTATYTSARSNATLCQLPPGPTFISRCRV